MTAGSINRVIGNIGGQTVSTDSHRGANAAAANGGKNNSAKSAANAAYAPIDGRDVVSLSAYVPQPLAAKTLLAAENIADKMAARLELRRAETAEINENNVYRALIGMRLYAQNGGDLNREIWTGGLQPPSPEELREAYKRLTQRVIGASEVKNPETARQMRTDLLDFFRDTDWQSFNLLAPETAKASA